MNYFKLLFFLIAACLLATLASAQNSRVQSVTVTPSLYPDTITKPAAVISNTQEKSAAPKNEIHNESITVTPETKLSIGKASAVPTEVNESSTQVKKEKNNTSYSEQNAEKQDAPVTNPSVNPK